MLRLGINGYGRIGRSILRALYERASGEHMQVVAINELADAGTILHLTRYDSTHGRFPLPLEGDRRSLRVGDDTIALLNHEDTKALPWGDLGVDMVLECSGAFSDRATAQVHLDRGAKKVLFSQPAEIDVDETVVFGVNHKKLHAGQRIVSNASCTTNAIVPVIQALDEAVGIETGTITTIHSAMNDQPVLDAYHHTDLRKTRAASHSVIPVDTELAKGITRLLPMMEGRFSAQALRVPTLNVSALDLTVVTGGDTDVVGINQILKNASLSGFDGVLGYTEELLASCDFNHDPRSGIVDASQTRVSGARLVKVLIWFDNEWGYANRMLDVAGFWHGLA
ncbi:MAG: glyceraldehyde 3-phosphate dehydrogenase NAD-binding domain-containing protein [Halioglobus sp.]|nr:glyceraldehyde 3-phosphate dehydrogenase NAD-binding domain-containing protein [Halioglobus sp.]